jgi:hypothetical protein
MRRQILIVLLACAAWGGAAQAREQTHYTCNDGMPGFTTCRDSHGNTYIVNEDQFGATVIDNHGNRSRIQDDGFGGQTIRRSDGSTVRSQTDMFGNTTYDDGQGHRTRCRPSAFSFPGQSDEDCD